MKEIKFSMKIWLSRLQELLILVILFFLNNCWYIDYRKYPDYIRNYKGNIDNWTMQLINRLMNK